MKIDLCVQAVVIFMCCGFVQAQSSSQVEGFLEPLRSIDVASTETGRVESIHVVIGQAVPQNEPLATLDDELQRALCKIAEKQANATGAIEAAKADQSMHKMRIRQLEQLTKGGYARPEELLRAQTDLAVSTARLQQAEENKKISEAELERYQIQLARRTIFAPVPGVVSELLRDPGEFVSPTEPYVVRMLQLDPLLAVFSLQDASSLRVGTQVNVQVGFPGESRSGVVDSIAPMMEAESGTIQVRIRIPNPEYQLKAGSKCWLLHGSNGPDESALRQASSPIGRLPRPSR